MTGVARRSARPFRVLLIEEGTAARALLERMIAPHSLHPVATAADAIAQVARDGGMPDLVLLDVAVPDAGRATLESLKAHPGVRHVPVIVLADAAASAADVTSYYHRHACCCLRKPADREALGALLRSVAAYWLGGQVLLPSRPAGV